MIDSFTLNYQNRRYSFERADSNLMYSGYVNKLYSGKSSFVVKYRKNVELMAVDKKFDEFYLVTRMFLVRENSIDQFSGRLEFLRLMGEHKKAVRSYMKKNNIAPSKNNPESFIPLIKYFDSLS